MKPSALGLGLSLRPGAKALRHLSGPQGFPLPGYIPYELICPRVLEQDLGVEVLDTDTLKCILI